MMVVMVVGGVTVRVKAIGGCVDVGVGGCCLCGVHVIVGHHGGGR